MVSRVFCLTNFNRCVVFFFWVAFVPLYSQTASGKNNPSSLSDLGDVDDPLARFYQRYSPKSDYLQSIDPSAFEADYKTILRMVKDLHEELIPALVVYMDNGAWGAFRETFKDSISSKYKFLGQSKSYFENVVSQVAFSSHLRNCTRILEKAVVRFEEIKDSLGFIGFSEEEVLDTQYKISRGLGILYSFFHSSEGLKKSKKCFDFILNGSVSWQKPKIKPLVKDQAQIAEACRYNSGISSVLSKYHQSDDVLRLFYKREELFYLWNLIALTIENPQFRDSQYMRICKDFFPIMDFNGPRFHQHYAKYVGIMGLNYSKEDAEIETPPSPTQ